MNTREELDMNNARPRRPVIPVVAAAVAGILAVGLSTAQSPAATLVANRAYSNLARRRHRPS
jgi:hypothetical protein